MVYSCMIDADANGPVLTVNRRRPTRTSGLPVTMRFPAEGVNIDFPDHLDGNMTVYDRTLNIFNHLRVYAWDDGSPVAMQHRSYSPYDEGHGSKLAERIGTSASGVAAPFGILRGWEVQQTGHPIGHALQMVLPRWSHSNRPQPKAVEPVLRNCRRERDTLSIMSAPLDIVPRFPCKPFAGGQVATPFS